MKTHPAEETVPCLGTTTLKFVNFSFSEPIRMQFRFVFVCSFNVCKKAVCEILLGLHSSVGT